MTSSIRLPLPIAVLLVACGGQTPLVSPSGTATAALASPSPRATPAATATLPPFGELDPVRFTVVGRVVPEGTFTDVFSYAGPDRGRVDLGRRTIPGQSVGDRIVWDGRRYLYYRAGSNTYEYGGTPPGTHALDVLFLEFVWSRSSSARHCRDRRVLEETTLLGRRAIHVACPPSATEWWVDIENGLILRHVSSARTTEITNLEFDPAFAPGTFDTSPPPGAKELGA